MLGDFMAIKFFVECEKNGEVCMYFVCDFNENG